MVNVFSIHTSHGLVEGALSSDETSVTSLTMSTHCMLLFSQADICVDVLYHLHLRSPNSPGPELRLVAAGATTAANRHEVDDFILAMHFQL